jgi:tetratricopeptide (TPR) repeat protein
MFTELVARRKAHLRPEHPDTLASQANLVVACLDAGRFDEAISNAKELNDHRTQTLGPLDPERLNSRNLLGRAYLAAKRFRDAEDILSEALASRIKLAPDDWRRYETTSQLGACLAARGELSAAKALLAEGYEGMKARSEKIPAWRKKELTAALERLIALFEAAKDPETAATWRNELNRLDQISSGTR